MALGHVLYIFSEEREGEGWLPCVLAWGPLWPLLRWTHLFTSIKLEGSLKCRFPVSFSGCFRVHRDWSEAKKPIFWTSLLESSDTVWPLGNTSIAPPVSYKTLNFLLSCEIGKPHDLLSHTEVNAHNEISSSSLFIMKHVGAARI